MVRARGSGARAGRWGRRTRAPGTTTAAPASASRGTSSWAAGPGGGSHPSFLLIMFIIVIVLCSQVLPDRHGVQLEGEIYL